MRPALAAVVACLAAVCAAVAGARGSDAIRFDVRADASAVLVDASGRDVCELRLEIESADGTPAKLLRARGSRKARAIVGGRTFHLRARVRDAGGGVLVDVCATPAVARGERGAWSDPAAVLARVVARLPAGAIGRGSAVVCGAEVLLGPDEAFGPDALARARGVRKEPARAKGFGRTVRIVPETAAPFTLQCELPGVIELEEHDGSEEGKEGKSKGSGEGADGDAGEDAREKEIVLRLAETDSDTATRLAYAVYVGRRPYAGRPVFIEPPSVEHLPGLGCFEARLRAFGEWSDPFDPEDVAVEAAWRAAPRSGRVSGFYSRDLDAEIVDVEDSEDGEQEERFAALGWPSFRARMPRTATGGEAVIAFATRGGRAEARARVPSSRLPPKPAGARGPRSAAGVTLDPYKWRTTEEAAKSFLALRSARLRTARLPIHEGEWGLEGGRPGKVDLEAAWRLDRAFESAAKRGVRIVPVLGRGWPPEKFAEESAYLEGDEPLARSAREFFEAPAPRQAFRRTLRYAAARWGSLGSLAGWEIFDGPDLLADGTADAARPESVNAWLVSMAEWLKSHDPKHPAIVTLRAGGSAESLKRAGIAVGRALELATDGESAGRAFELAREAGSEADYIVLETKEPGAEPAHAALWAAAAAGAGGGIFLGPGAAKEAAAIVRYLGEGDALGDLPSKLAFEEDGYRLFGRRGPMGAMWWLARTGGVQAPSDDGDDDEPGTVRFLPVIRGVEFEVDGLVPGRYAVEWWQTHEGRRLTRSEVRVPEGRVLLTAPPFASDIAGRLVRIVRPTTPAMPDTKVPPFLGR